jgi:glutamate carboxypeptidase
MVKTFEQARRLAASIGLILEEGSTGGGSDGNFTSGLGIPTLDGMGAVGDGAHAAHEHIVIASLAERAALLATILTQWEV